MPVRFIAAAAALMVAAGPAFADCSLSADAQAGKSVSNQCKACHVFVAGKPPLPTGPNLHDVYGAVAGSSADFPKYSEGMKGAHDKGVVWNDDTLFDYIGDPGGFLTKVNGKEVKHAMLFQLKDEAKRKSVIAFLKAIKGNNDCN